MSTENKAGGAKAPPASAYAGRIKVGLLGPRGTFSEQAARQFIDRQLADTVRRRASGNVVATMQPYRDIADLLFAADRGEVDIGVVPAENSIEGSVAVTLDMLVHDVNLVIVGEVVIPVRHHLLVKSGVALEDIRKVVSHPQALAQCRRYLQTHLPDAVLQPALSTAAAAQEVAASERGDVAAIGTELSADLYGLSVAAANVQDVSDNATRFFVVTQRTRQQWADVLTTPTGRDKTSIVFRFGQDRPGNLYGALGEFAARRINLSKLESRPAKRVLGDYMFFADIEGHIRDKLVVEALDALVRRCAYMKILGSYPRMH